MNKKTQSIILGIMCLLLTVAICIQIKTVNTNGTTVGGTQEENELRAQVLEMKEKYENSLRKLERAEEELETVRQAVTSNNEELENLEAQIKQANTLLGFTDVRGQGVTITVTDGTITANTLNPSDLLVHYTDVLSIINELKNAGAEAIEVNGQRIVATTSVMCDGNVIMVNGERISSPFTINAIGLPEQLATLTRPGGFLNRLEEYNIGTTFTKLDSVTISRYAGGISFTYAKTRN